MRLLNVETRRLESLLATTWKWPRYTILSHTWGEGEITFEDIKNETQSYIGMTGYAKLDGCCVKSEREGFNYTWIDTCCIDKSSSAELSEAINSMFQWYEKAQVCYAYLADVDGFGSDDPEQASSSFRKSRWFTRGWTLQELLAPREVVFLNKDWKEIGTRKSLSTIIQEITGITADALENPLCGSESCPHPCKGHSVAQKLSWAAKRNTTRQEDRAYSLMGLFDVNMPLLYGEGGEKAFERLQREIMKQSSDDSIFAWSSIAPLRPGVFIVYARVHSGFIARHLELFAARPVFRVYTAASASVLATTTTTLGVQWLPATLLHNLTNYEHTKHHLSLTAPILSLKDLRGGSKVRLFSRAAQKTKGRDIGFTYEDESVHEILQGSKVMAVLSCCFEVGRVGIILDQNEDGTYSRPPSGNSIFAVQFSEIPVVRHIKIRHREGLGVECQVPRKPKIGQLDVTLAQGGGYSAIDRYFIRLNWGGKITRRWSSVRKRDWLKFPNPTHAAHAALLYAHGDEQQSPRFAIGFKWDEDRDPPLGFIGTIIDSDGVQEDICSWADRLSWDSDWWVPGSKSFRLSGGKHVVVNMRQAPDTPGRGQCWNVLVSVCDQPISQS